MSATKSREQILLEAALRFESESERKAFLDAACANDPALRRRIEELLAASSEADAFFRDDPLKQAGLVPAAALPTATGPSAPPLSEVPGTVIDKYKLLEKLGEGGFGVVYMAEQREPVKRRVALKIIKIGMDTKEVVARFEAERQALAMMDHPNIAKVFDAGSTERPLTRPPGTLSPAGPAGGEGRGEGDALLSAGRPYFAMELVRGIRITEYCDEKKLSTRERLDLFVQVCQAVQHAHQKGIIHRDLKPSNILVTVNDGVPVPKIIDFGIAKATQAELTGKTVFTRFHQFLGTPSYMSPEQAELTSLDIDTRSDIYSLGVLLYELLTGKTPFDAEELLKAGLDEMRRVIREKEPERPSTRVSTLRGEELTTTAKRRGLEAPKLINVLRGDLDWIVMKCLEKDRARRYETANSLASDIQRHLNNEPVVACPPSKVYRLSKLVRRNRLAFAASGAVAAALVVGLAIALWQSIEKTRAYNRANTEAAKSEHVAQFLKDMLAGAGPEVAKGRDATILLEILAQTNERIGRDLTNQPAVKADLLDTIGGVYEALGQYDKSEILQREALAIREKFFGGEHRQVADALNNLAVTLLTQGKLAETEDLLRKSLAMCRKLHEKDANVVMVLCNLADVLRGQGKYSEAKLLAFEAVTLSKKLPGDDSPKVAFPLGRLGMSEFAQGDYRVAETHLREAVAILEKAPAGQALNLQGTRANLAVVLSAQNKWQEAETVEREILALKRKLLRDDHPLLAATLGNLGFTLAKQGKLLEAETLYREALEIQRKRLGTEDPVIANTLNDLAMLLRDQGKLTDAAALLREAVDLLRKQAGRDAKQGNPALGLKSANFAGVLAALGQLAEARSVAEEAVALYRRNPDWEVNEHFNAFATLAGVLADQGNLAEAEALQSELLAVLRERAPDKVPLPGALAELAVTLIAENKFTNAEPLARECLEFRHKHFPESWIAFSARVLLGQSLLGQKKYADAGPLLLSGYEGMAERKEKVVSDAWGSRRQPRLKKALELLVQFYEETGHPDQAAEWKARLTALNRESANGQVESKKPSPQ